MVAERFAHLEEARAAMCWRVAAERFVLAGFEEAPAAADLGLLGVSGQLIREGGETTLLVPACATSQLLARHPTARLEEDLAWIRFEGAMDWELVGFLALVTGALAAEGIPLGALCGFSRDHLFVAERYLERARIVLQRLFGPEES